MILTVDGRERRIEVDHEHYGVATKNDPLASVARTWYSIDGEQASRAAVVALIRSSDEYQSGELGSLSWLQEAE